MKVLYIGRYNKSEELSGPEKVAKRIFAESSKENETAFLEYFFDGSVYGAEKKLFGYEAESENGLKIYRIGLLRIPFFLLKFRPQIIHIITFERFSIIAYLYKMFSKTKIIYNVHGVAVYENENFKNIPSSLKRKDFFCEKVFMQFSNKLLFLSAFELHIARKYYQISSNQIQSIDNGIDKEFYSANKTNEKNKNLSLVFIGDSERKDKDFKFLYSNLDKINQSCSLHIIGKFNTKVYKSQVGSVEIHPVQKMDKYSLIKFLTGKNIFISSSFYDTFSIAAAECMALGLAPILTDSTGISKLIVNGENGFIVNHGDGKDLADKINLLLENENLRNQIANESVKIYEKLNWENIFSSYIKIYKSIV